MSKNRRPGQFELQVEDPFLSIESDDAEATAECGCRLVRDCAGHPAIYMCPMHKAAADALAACEKLATWDQSAGSAVLISEACSLARAALANAGMVD